MVRNICLAVEQSGVGGTPPLGSPVKGSPEIGWLVLLLSEIFVEGFCHQPGHRLASALLFQPQVTQVLWADLRTVCPRPLRLVLRHAKSTCLDLPKTGRRLPACYQSPTLP